ncbi:MAG: SDR family oxidoreductase [Spirulinaceae cyanobacterium]
MSKTVLITGASSGIGYELSKLFAKDSYDLVLVARSENKLQDLAAKLQNEFGIQVKVIVQDLAINFAPKTIFAELQEENITIDVLVNNAGFAAYGLFTETNLQAELEMMQLNMVALTHLTKLFLPGMVQRRQGKILNVASTAAFQPGPLMAVYYATKAYVLSFSEAIANELIGTGVTVTVLCPGPTKSGFQARADVEKSKLFRGSNMMDTQTVAEIGYSGLMASKTVIVPGFQNKFIAAFIKFLPRKLVTKIVCNVQKEV